MNFNINNAECIKTVEHFGAHEYVNICSGSRTTLDWAFGDWVLMGFLVAILVGVGLLIRLSNKDF